MYSLIIFSDIQTALQYSQRKHHYLDCYVSNGKDNLTNQGVLAMTCVSRYICVTLLIRQVYWEENCKVFL